MQLPSAKPIHKLPGLAWPFALQRNFDSLSPHYNFIDDSRIVPPHTRPQKKNDCYHIPRFTMDIDDEDDFYAPEEPQAQAQATQAQQSPSEAAPPTKKDANDELEEGEEEDEGWRNG